MISPRAAALRAHTNSIVVAAADVGSTSVHLLVAAVGGERLEPLADESAFLGLGDAVDARSHLGSALIETLAATIAGYLERAHSLGAGQVAFLGTDPLRRAADAPAAVDAVWQRGGTLHVLTQDEEAMLTMIGVTGGRRVERGILVVDVGGGSTELVVATPDGRPTSVGLPLGASRLTGQIVRHDPPTRAEIEELGTVALKILAGVADAGGGDLVLVGGTASNLLRLMPEPASGRLTQAGLAAAIDVLAGTTAADLVTRYAIRPQRARVLPAGAAIVAALLERHGSTEGRVSGAGVREGAILVLARAGAGWRDALPKLAGGWR